MKRKQELVKQLEEDIGTASEQLEEVRFVSLFFTGFSDVFTNTLNFDLDRTSSRDPSDRSDAFMDGADPHNRSR